MVGTTAALTGVLPNPCSREATFPLRTHAEGMEPHRAEITLVRAELDARGLHTGTSLSRKVSQGSQLRIRRGVYVESQSWSAALPSHRYNASMAAVALAGSAGVFCRESALILHGLPLLKLPSEVHLRTLHRSQVGVHRTPGRLSYPTRLHEPPLPRGVTRAQLRAALAAGSVGALASENAGVLGLGVLAPGAPDPAASRCEPLTDGSPAGFARQILTPDCLRSFTADHAGLIVSVEPLPLALLDTVPRMPFDQAVVVLDAALARMAEAGVSVDEALHCWWPYLRGSRLQKNWTRAVVFADPRAASVGESLSRVRISEFGFQAPELQNCLWVEGRQYWVDFEWDGIVGEFDGRHKYLRSQELFGISAEEALYREKRREDAIRSTGRRVVRWSWDDLYHPHALRDRLTRFGVPRA